MASFRSTNCSLSVKAQSGMVKAMKTVPLEELDERTGQWLQQASQHEQVLVTAHGQPLLSIWSSRPVTAKSGFRNRVLLPDYQAHLGRLGGGTDSTLILSEDRDRPAE